MDKNRRCKRAHGGWMEFVNLHPLHPPHQTEGQEVTTKAKELGDMPAQPFQCQGPTTGPEIYYGMTIRQQLAGMMMAALVANGKVPENKNTVATVSIQYADALLEALAKE